MTFPWEDSGIPPVLRRDANNRAPWMDAPLKIKLDGSTSIGGKAVIGVVLSPLSGIGPEKTVFFSPATSPPANPPNLVLPWATNFPPRDA